DNQAQLKQVLQDEKKASKLENLAAALLGRLLDVPIAVANSGFQHGGDAGPSGRQGRRFRIECKKYSDTTSLSERELLGEIDHALSRDQALEAWLLVATRSVSEQLELNLTQKGEELGVPVVILDWKDSGLCSLAALCAFAPDLVEELFSPEASAFARLLQPASADAIDQIRRNLQSWNLGFESLRRQSHAKLEDIWGSPRRSKAELGQDAAGGAQPKKVKRVHVHTAMDNWWNGPAKSDSPLAIVGWEGVGKTWAALDWLVDHRGEQPIILIVPSSAAAGLTGISESTVKRFLADRLYELGGKRDQAHWHRRLDYLLNRPADEGPVLTVFFDGLNQEPSVSWLQLLKVLQGPAFEGKVRVIVSTRYHHLNDRLSKLRSLVVPPVLVGVDLYDADPSGELDQMLAFEGLTQNNLQSDLIELARTPRLFKLVVSFRERLVTAGQVTVHRLLWEYGRDTFGERATGRSFSENEWRDWLKEVAQSYRDGVRDFSVKALAETASRRDLTESEVFARLSDIIDGRFARQGPSGSLQLTPTVVSHALAVALLSHLAAIPTQTFDAINFEVSQWLDPIAGLDQHAEILRAAVSILVERNDSAFTVITSVLVTAWLQTQNIGDKHRRELAALAGSLLSPLLDAIEHSDGSVNASARLWAVNALRAIPRSDGAALTTIVNRIQTWFLVVSRDFDDPLDTNEELKNLRAKHFISRVGEYFSGPRRVLGLPLSFVDRDDGVLGQTAPSILEGFPLALAMPVFEAAAVALAVAGRNGGWDGLTWLCLLNECDSDETAVELRNLSARVLKRLPEPGINPALPSRVASLVLLLTGFEIDEETANWIDPGIDRFLTYEKDYLPKPGQSFFPLERRHAEAVLLDTELTLHFRIQRTKELWLDPTFKPPPAFIEEVRAAATHIDVEKLNRSMGRTIEDDHFEDIRPVLARCAPDLLADIARRILQSFGTCPSESRHWNAIHATDQFVMVDGRESVPAQVLRTSARAGDEDHETFAASQFLILEIWNLSASEQIAALVEANLKCIINGFSQILKAPSPEEVDRLVARFSEGTSKQQRDLLILLSIHPVAFNDYAWAWAEGFARSTHDNERGLAYRTLARVDAVRFGRTLATWDWSWSANEHYWVNHYGSGALIEATQAVPFDQVAPRLAPWRLLEAVRRRGADPAEVLVAADIFGHILSAEMLEEPDPGSILSVDCADTDDDPLVFSIKPRSSEDNTNDFIAALRATMDFDARKRAVDTAIRRIQEARTAGANLYLTHVGVEDFAAVLEHVPDLVDGWLQGMVEQTPDFKRRARLAEGAYLSLCEALLGHDPDRGATLWRALRQAITTRFIGVAGVEEFLHMAFRAPESSAVAAIRDALFGLDLCHSDDALYELALAASLNRKDGWLEAQITADRASSLAWRRKRATVLSGFISNNKLPVEGAWPCGEVRTSEAGLTRKSARLRWIEACAHQWWRAFLAAQDPADAYATWILFLRSADRRAWVWMRDEAQAVNDTDQFFQLKMTHVELNRPTMKRETEERLRGLDKRFLDKKMVDEIGPWRKK
ncbi:MAG TPA: hypothetical protein VIT00_07655, partial [Terrimicrobiaceae bacterium]